MKSKKTIPASKGKVETAKSLKEDTQKEKGVKKGYNEKNPTQPQGAFKPDAASSKN